MSKLNENQNVSVDVLRQALASVESLHRILAHIEREGLDRNDYADQVRNYKDTLRRHIKNASASVETLVEAEEQGR